MRRRMCEQAHRGSTQCRARGRTGCGARIAPRHGHLPRRDRRHSGARLLVSVRHGARRRRAWIAWVPLPDDTVASFRLVGRAGADSVLTVLAARVALRFHPPEGRTAWMDTTSFAPTGTLTLPAGEGIRLTARAAPGAAALAGAGIRAPLPASHVHGCHHGTAIIEGNDDPVYSRLPALGAEVEDVLPVVPEPARLLWRSRNDNFLGRPRDENGLDRGRGRGHPSRAVRVEELELHRHNAADLEHPYRVGPGVDRWLQSVAHHRVVEHGDLSAHAGPGV